MITNVTMPKLGLTMTEGTILTWFKQEGQAVRVGEGLLSVQTDKVAIDVEAPASGCLLKIIVPEGATVPLETILAYIGEPGEAIPLQSQPATASLTQIDSPPAAPSVAAAPALAAGPLKVSPIARKLAEQHGLDLASIQGSGPQGRIVEVDITAALKAREMSSHPQPVPLEVTYHLQPMTAVRKVTARRMSESFHDIPHFYLSVELNAAPLTALRQNLLAEFEHRYGIRLTYTDLLLKALAHCLPAHPRLNAAIHAESEVKLYDEINLGVAIASGQGLVVGVLRGADRLSLAEVALERQRLAAVAAAGRFSLQDVSGGTFTLTNLGMYGVDDFSPIINPGQSAILAAGAIAERPLNEGGQVVLRPSLRLTLAVDHRVADGVDAALFLKDLRQILEVPENTLTTGTCTCGAVQV